MDLYPGRREGIGATVRRIVTADELSAPLLSYERALELVLATVSPLPAAEVLLGDALGLALAEGVSADHDVPRWPASAMDGYAVTAADTAGACRDAPVRLPVWAHLPAGSAASGAHVPGTAVRIMTGAPLPLGADAVIPREATEELDEAVLICSPAALGRHVRPRGEDALAGELLLSAGTVLGVPELMGLAGLGYVGARVRPRPRVAVVVSGDEVVPPGTPLGAGQVHDANATMLDALCRCAGAGVVSSRHVGDELSDVVWALREASTAADVVVATGGVSVGEHDWLRVAIEQLGELVFWRAAIKPAKPVAVGRVCGVPVVALPGNPGSAFVAAHAFLVPVLRAMRGADPAGHIGRGIMSSAVGGVPDRLLFLPVSVAGSRVVPIRRRSHVGPCSLLGAQALALVPPAGVRAGASVRLLPV